MSAPTQVTVTSANGSVANIAEFIVQGVSSASGRPIVNVFHYAANPPALVTANITALMTNFQSVVVTPLLACLSSTYSLSRIRCRFVDNLINEYTDALTTTAGGVTGNALPTDSAAFVYLTSGYRGRSYNGSKHFGPLPESKQVNDRLDDGMGALPAVWSTLAAALQATISDGTGVWSPAILSRTKSPGLLLAGGNILASLVYGCKVDRTIGTMRRRREKTV